MSVMIKIGLAAVALWLLAHIHVFMIYRTSLLSLLIFILGGLIVAGLMLGRHSKESPR